MTAVTGFEHWDQIVTRQGPQLLVRHGSPLQHPRTQHEGIEPRDDPDDQEQPVGEAPVKLFNREGGVDYVPQYILDIEPMLRVLVVTRCYRLRGFERSL